MDNLTHIDSETGNVKMVDVSEKNISKRYAKAMSKVSMEKNTMDMLLSGKSKKGNVFETARIAGIMAVKKTYELIPLCHPININFIGIDFEIEKKINSITILCEIISNDKTGAEMEALTGASIASLTIYDMLKAVDKGMVISQTCLLEKSGGKSGHFIRK